MNLQINYITKYKGVITETVAQGYFVKRVFLEISQIHRKAPVREPLF